MKLYDCVVENEFFDTSLTLNSNLKALFTLLTHLFI